MSTTPQASGVIHAECASKANSRKVWMVGDRKVFAKSDKALAFMRAKHDTNKPFAPIEGPIQLNVRCYYATRRPDLDPSMVMDWLQANNIIANDRQVVSLIAHKIIAPKAPRVEWSVIQVQEPVDTRAA